MKKSLLVLAFAACSAVASAQQVDYVFTDDVRLDCPKISDQQYSGTCWCFSSLSFMESEMMFFGNPNPPNLSEMFVVRQNYIDRVDKYVMLHGKMNFGQGSYFLDNFIVAKEHGLMPESAFPNTKEGESRINHSRLESRIQNFADSVADDNRKELKLVWRDNFLRLLNSYFAPVKEEFTYNGKTYTPRTFADEVVKLPFDDYVQVTSFSHHEFYKPFILEIPDNWRWEPFINLPLNEMISVMDSALAQGHTILWASDVSENGFRMGDGYAILPGLPYPSDPASNSSLKGKELRQKKEAYNNALRGIEEFKTLDVEAQRKRAKDFKGAGVEINVTQEFRQTEFLNRHTTDDHGMHIVGKAHDQFGNKFYIVKNSWGTTGKYKGYFYVSEAFVKAKTTGILVHKSALSHIKL